MPCDDSNGLTNLQFGAENAILKSLTFEQKEPVNEYFESIEK